MAEQANKNETSGGCAAAGMRHSTTNPAILPAPFLGARVIPFTPPELETPPFPPPPRHVRALLIGPHHTEAHRLVVTPCHPHSHECLSAIHRSYISNS